MSLDQQNPWGQPRSRKTPPRPGEGFDLDSFLMNLKEKLLSFRNNGGGPNNTGMVYLVLAALFLIWLGSGVYIVKEGEQAAVLRFGACTGLVGPGLRYHAPYPFEAVIKYNVAATNYLSSEDRFDILPAKIRHFYYGEERVSKPEQEDFYMLTGDENLVDLSKYTVLWRIKDLKKFLFHVRAPQALILAAADSALREIIAKTPINLIITEKRAQVNDEVSVLLQELLDRYDCGIHVVEFLIQKADPPEPVLDAFLDVTRAEADLERSQHEARSYRDEIIPKARAVARKITLESEGYAKEILAKSEGEAGRFRALYQEYKKAPEVTRQRLYTETMEGVLGEADKIILDSDAGAVLPHLPLISGSRKKKQRQVADPSPEDKIIRPGNND